MYGSYSAADAGAAHARSPYPGSNGRPDSFQPRADPSLRPQRPGFSPALSSDSFQPQRLGFSPGMGSGERDPFRIMNEIGRRDQQPQEKLDEKRWAPDEWGGTQSREWSQKLELLHDTESVSSFGNFEQFPEQSNLVLMPDEDDHMPNMDERHGLPGNPRTLELLHEEMDALIAESSEKQRLHDQMDALIAESSSRQLFVEEEMLLRNADINRMQRLGQPNSMMQPYHSNMGPAAQRAFAMHQGRPPPEPREHFDDGLFSAFRCFRACS